jgi:hypothetical protein
VIVPIADRKIPAALVPSCRRDVYTPRNRCNLAPSFVANLDSMSDGQCAQNRGNSQ